MTKGVPRHDRPVVYWNPAVEDVGLEDMFRVPQRLRQGPELPAVREHRPGEFSCYRFSPQTVGRRLMRYTRDSKRAWTYDEALDQVRQFGGFVYACPSGLRHWHTSKQKEP